MMITPQSRFLIRNFNPCYLVLACWTSVILFLVLPTIAHEWLDIHKQSTLHQQFQQKFDGGKRNSTDQQDFLTLLVHKPTSEVTYKDISNRSSNDSPYENETQRMLQVVGEHLPSTTTTSSTKTKTRTTSTKSTTTTTKIPELKNYEYFNYVIDDHVEVRDEKYSALPVITGKAAYMKRFSPSLAASPLETMAAGARIIAPKSEQHAFRATDWIRIDCGSNKNYTDPVSGEYWMRDTYFEDGMIYRPTRRPWKDFFRLRKKGHVAKTNDTKYKTFRETSFYDSNNLIPWKSDRKKPSLEYSIPVFDNRRKYKLIFHFFDLIYDQPGERLLNVWVEDIQIVSRLDIIQYSRSLNDNMKNITDIEPLAIISTVLTVTDGELNIRIEDAKCNKGNKDRKFGIFRNGVPCRGDAMISALEVQVQPQFNPLLINAGSKTTYTDNAGRIWLPDAKYATGGITFQVSNLTKDVNETMEDLLYQTERYGDFKYNFINLPNATFSLLFHFAEVYFSKIGERVFNILVDGNIIFPNVDLVLLGYGQNYKAISLEYVHTTTSGTLEIEFKRGLKNTPKLSALEIGFLEPHLAHAVIDGPYETVDIDNDNFEVVQVSGLPSHTHSPGSSLVDFVWKEGRTTIGRGQDISLRLSVGTHDISLYVRDMDGNDATDTSTITILPFGHPFISSLTPSEGDLKGMNTISIRGSGFSHPKSNIEILFGTYKLPPSDFSIVNKETIRVIVPPATEPIPVFVSITTPVGSSKTAVYTYIDKYPIKFTNGKVGDVAGPTTVAFGPDGRLYVGTISGKLYRYTLNDDFTSIVEYIESSIVQKAGGGGVGVNQRSILGITFDPMDTDENPTVYVSHSFLFHGGNYSSSGVSINGKVSTVSGSNLDVYNDIITGLPVSDHDHGINGMEFGDHGELYIQVGGNTNGGVPGELSGTRLQKESYLSSATLVAHLSSPDFNGFLQYDKDDDGILLPGVGVEIFASGQRNPYDIVLHSNGLLYGTDNGSNVGYGDMSVGCDPVKDNRPDIQEEDKINLITKGAYYGHPNRIRGLKDRRQCKFRSMTEASDEDYTAPITIVKSSIDGIIEFQSDHFGGQLRYNLIISKYKNGIFRVVLSTDGRSVMSMTPIQLIKSDSLDVAQAPDGTLISIGNAKNQIMYLKPADVPSKVVTIKSVFPRRGSHVGGTDLNIYGENFFRPLKVTVGKNDCPIVDSEVTVTRIVCVLPGSSAGTVDVKVSSGSKSTVMERGYRYITGLPF